jgi:beta-alanine--pyruvate transaminase
VSYTTGLSLASYWRPFTANRVRARAFEIFVDCFQRDSLVRATGDIVAFSPPLIAEAHGSERTVSSIDQSLRSVA